MHSFIRTFSSATLSHFYRNKIGRLIGHFTHRGLTEIAFYDMKLRFAI